MPPEKTSFRVNPEANAESKNVQSLGVFDSCVMRLCAVASFVVGVRADLD